jgi:ribosomal subunit interface protein
MDLHFTGRGVEVTDAVRIAAERKLASLGRIEPRTVRIDVEFIAENYPRPNGTKRVEAKMRIPRKTFFAHAEADDVPSALDRLVDKLERQLRDYTSRRKDRHRGRGVASAQPGSPAADTFNQ